MYGAKGEKIMTKQKFLDMFIQEHISILINIFHKNQLDSLKQTVLSNQKIYLQYSFIKFFQVSVFLLVIFLNLYKNLSTLLFS